MDYVDMLRDISIARNLLDDSYLNVIVSDQKLICEILCIPSFPDQAFYLQIYDGDKYSLLYAKSYLQTPCGISSVSDSFSTIAEADRHVAYRGDVYCGLIHLPKEDEIVNRLIACLPAQTEVIPERGITLDGVTTLVISHISEISNALYFRNEAEFVINDYTSENVHFLHNLYLHIQGIIGNLLQTNR